MNYKTLLCSYASMISRDALQNTAFPAHLVTVIPHQCELGSMLLQFHQLDRMPCNYDDSRFKESMEVHEQD